MQPPAELSPSQALSLFLTFTYAYSPCHSTLALSPSVFFLFSRSSTSLFLPLFLWLCFFPSGVQMTLMVIAVKPTLWPVSTVCQFPLLSLCQTVLVPSMHAGRRKSALISCYYLIVANVSPLMTHSCSCVPFNSQRIACAFSESELIV